MYQNFFSVVLICFVVMLCIMWVKENLDEDISNAKDPSENQD